MKKLTITLTMVILVSALLMSACSALPVQIPEISAQVPVAQARSEQANSASPAT